MYILVENVLGTYVDSPISMKPAIAQTMQSRSVLLKNMFDPEEYVPSACWMYLADGMLVVPRETERDWDKDLAEDVKGECEEKYGNVLAIKVEKETQVNAYLAC
jgi:hypothetical protein